MESSLIALRMNFQHRRRSPTNTASPGQPLPLLGVLPTAAASWSHSPPAASAAGGSSPTTPTLPLPLLQPLSIPVVTTPAHAMCLPPWSRAHGVLPGALPREPCLKFRHSKKGNQTTLGGSFGLLVVVLFYSFMSHPNITIEITNQYQFS